MADFVEKELGWDDEIQNDGQKFTVIPEGDYHFGVAGFERARHGGSEKIPACNKAIITLAIMGPEYPFRTEKLGEVKVNLFLHTKFEWKLCQFFTAIGMRKHGEKLHMDWNRVIGTDGTCHVGICKWTGNDGKEHESNEVTEFYDPEKSPLRPAEQTEIFGAATGSGSYTPGKF